MIITVNGTREPHEEREECLLWQSLKKSYQC